MHGKLVINQHFPWDGTEVRSVLRGGSWQDDVWCRAWRFACVRLGEKQSGAGLEATFDKVHGHSGVKNVCSRHGGAGGAVLIRRPFPRHSDLEPPSKPASFRLGTARGSLEALVLVVAKWQAL